MPPSMLSSFSMPARSIRMHLAGLICPTGRLRCLKTLVRGWSSKAARVIRFSSPSCGSIEVGHLHFSSKMQRTPAAIDKEWPALHAAFEQWLSPLNFDADGRQCVSLSSLIWSILK